MCAFRLPAVALLAFLSANAMALAQQPDSQGDPRAFLGIRVGPAEKGGIGVMIGSVTSDSPAAKAGLRPGDRILKLGNDEVRDVEKFLRDVAARKPGEKITLGIMREGKE